MWAGAFPEPLTFSVRALRALRARPGEFDIVHDNQGLGYGMLGVRRLGLPLVTSIHHPITVDRRLDLAGRGWLERLNKAPLVRVRADAGPGGAAGRAADHGVRVIQRRYLPGFRRFRPIKCRSSRWGSTPGCSAPARSSRA